MAAKISFGRTVRIRRIGTGFGTATARWCCLGGEGDERIIAKHYGKAIKIFADGKALARVKEAMKIREQFALRVGVVARGSLDSARGRLRFVAPWHRIGRVVAGHDRHLGTYQHPMVGFTEVP